MQTKRWYCVVKSKRKSHTRLALQAKLSTVSSVLYQSIISVYFKNYISTEQVVAVIKNIVCQCWPAWVCFRKIQ